MSGMDRLTDEEWAVQYLEDDAEACSAVNGSHDQTTKDARRMEVLVKRLIRERDDANRRASQATPASSDHAISKKWAERMLPLDEGVTPSAGAPAPSDGLREAVETIVNTHGFLTDLGYILGKQNGNYRRAWASAVVRREMIKLAQQYADDGIQALIPAPAQEGGE